MPAMLVDDLEKLLVEVSVAVKLFGINRHANEQVIRKMSRQRLHAGFPEFGCKGILYPTAFFPIRNTLQGGLPWQPQVPDFRNKLHNQPLLPPAGRRLLKSAPGSWQAPLPFLSCSLSRTQTHGRPQLQEQSRRS